MEWFENGLMALAIALPAIVGLMLVTTASRLTRLRLRRSSVATVGREDIPPPVRLTLDQAEPFLTGLGFVFRYSTVSRRAVATEGDQHLITTGARLETYVLEGQPGTGKILINGGAAHLIKAGERVTIMAFAVSGVPVEPKILLLDEKNEVIREGR